MNDLRLILSVDDQELHLLRGDEPVKTYPISTAEKGVGFQMGSYRTPTGRFVIQEKIGDGLPKWTIFSARQPVGEWKPGESMDKDLILARVIRIHGLDPENANTMERFVYLHGTNQEGCIGTASSHGCIRLKNDDMIELFDALPVGTPLEIIPPTRKRGKLIFFDCDSTLSSIEGIDELARAGGPDTFSAVEALTHAAMNGEVPIAEVFPRRMEIIGPDRKTAETVAQLYLDTMTPGAREVISELKSRGWTPVILSGGFAPLIQPLAKELGIKHVEAVPLFFDDQGDYAGYGRDYPTTRNGGKPEIIRQWQAAMLPERTVMVGDGVSDLEASSVCDLFVGYGGVVQRQAVKDNAGAWITSLDELLKINLFDQA
jgi:phosphoserine phosphatase SerB